MDRTRPAKALACVLVLAAACGRDIPVAPGSVSPSNRISSVQSAPETVDIGTLGGNFAFAYAVNDEGVVTGPSKIANGHMHAYVWSSTDGMRDIGILDPRYDFAIAYDINDAGLVVGASRDEHGRRAVTWTARRGMIALEEPDGWTSSATGVNAAGDVAGWAASPGSTSESAVLWRQGGSPTLLGTLPGDSHAEAQDVNNADVVVGQSGGGSGSTGHAFIWSRDAGMRLIEGSPAGQDGIAWAVNDQGDVVGDYGAYGFRWNATNGMTVLRMPGADWCSAEDINDRGQVTGECGLSDGMHAFLWTEADGFQDLGLGAGQGLNRAGEIAGIGPDVHSARVWSFTRPLSH